MGEKSAKKKDKGSSSKKDASKRDKKSKKLNQKSVEQSSEDEQTMEIDVRSEDAPIAAGNKRKASALDADEEARRVPSSASSALSKVQFEAEHFLQSVHKNHEANKLCAGVFQALGDVVNASPLQFAEKFEFPSPDALKGLPVKKVDEFIEGAATLSRRSAILLWKVLCTVSPDARKADASSVLLELGDVSGIKGGLVGRGLWRKLRKTSRWTAMKAIKAGADPMSVSEHERNGEDSEDEALELLEASKGSQQASSSGLDAGRSGIDNNSAMSLPLEHVHPSVITNSKGESLVDVWGEAFASAYGSSIADALGNDASDPRVVALLAKCIRESAAFTTEVEKRLVVEGFHWDQGAAP